MPAHVPRRSFTRPFVVTLAMLPACKSEPASPDVAMNPPGPAEPTAPVASATPPAMPSTTATTTAVPSANPSSTSSAQTPASPADTQPQQWSLARKGNVCETTAATHCPQDSRATCNPPAPQVYDCRSANVTDGDTVTITRFASDSTCRIYMSVSCPKGVMCNPPPPRTVPCPTR